MSKERQWLEANGIEPEWRDDWTVGSHFEEYGEAYTKEDGTADEPAECLYVIVRNGEDEAAIGCVDDPSPEYARQLEEDLAFDLMRRLMVGPPADGIGL